MCVCARVCLYIIQLNVRYVWRATGLCMCTNGDLQQACE